MGTGNAHGRSGRVALPRMRVVLVRPALLELAEELARRAVRAVVVRRRVVDMLLFSIRLVELDSGWMGRRTQCAGDWGLRTLELRAWSLRWRRPSKTSS